MKSLTSLWSSVAFDMATRCCTSATQDVKTVLSRTEHEGLSFLAITLADFGKAVQKWLNQGFVVPSDAPSFKKDRLTGLPVFLQGFLGRVFAPGSGVLLDNPDIEAIYAIRQLTLAFSKIALPEDSEVGSSSVVTPRRERRAMNEFVQCEQDVKAADDRLDEAYKADFKRVSAMLFEDMFFEIDRKVRLGDIFPQHGPGSVADRLTSNGKWVQRSWPARLEEGGFPSWENLIPNLHPFYTEELNQTLNILEPGSEIPVRVITVPKTLKSPRIIAIEPTAMQYAQQALKREFYDAVDRISLLRRMIGFTDQEPNRQLARLGSLRGDLATLDMSEASDRVSNQHVRLLLEDHPNLHRAVQACRSRKADVPGHGVLRLAKFASMGSALCFPMEAMVFLTVCFLGIERELSSPLTRSSIKRLSRQVRVFGDDIIVPRDYVLSVVDELETFGFRVNISKSYWTGRFRESCGREYYDGHDVSIVKVRMVLPTRRQDANGVISAVALRNQLYWAGVWSGARWLDDYLRKLLTHYPNVAPTSPLLGRESALGYQFQRLDPATFSPLTKGYYERSKPPRDPLEGSGAMLKCLSRVPQSRFESLEPVRLKPRIDVASVDGEHLERTGRPEHVSIKLGWRTPY